ncbi:S8 family serine peptidase [Ningiella sp. W23]|uniref:S8 family serine peptidase n=1 Tax=Ningiella sp. W23 TaxID=3023715 RepID=UPI00375802A2
MRISFKSATTSVLVFTILSAYALEDEHQGGNKGLPSASQNQSPLQQPIPLHTQTIITKQHVSQQKASSRTRTSFYYEPDLAPGEYTYIVELASPAIAQRQDLMLSAKVRRQAATENSRKQTLREDTDILNYAEKLHREQQAFIHSLPASLKNAQSMHQYQYALNGLALKISQSEAMELAEHPSVKSIVRETIYKTTTDQGPSLIGAPQLWQGQIGSLAQSQGEGVVIGIIDSGINTDHPSFAERSADGYVHTNPLGSGVFLGDCATRFPELCNNKLIGLYSYSSITSAYSDTDVFPPNLARNAEDYDGHGSHVAATAAGNVLFNIPETLPTPGEVESNGTQTGFEFEQISGVAPRANIIGYQACFPGTEERGDTYTGCPGSAIIASLDDAIRDRVDVINFSISGGGNPWRDTTERAFLSAQAAGIFVATSAGNSGPGASSSSKHAPWYTAVAASEHGRDNAFVKQLNNFSGGINPPSAITGQSNTGAITADIVYAGDFSNPNDSSNDPAQCLQPFPSGTFSGQIVVCDRGEIARVEKAQNVQAGGAGGYVLANVQGGETFLANDEYVVPGIHINANDGDSLKQWLSSGENHRVTITSGVASQNIDEARIDVLAGFSARGPNTTISTLVPTMTAPGVNIYAAFADQKFGNDGQPPAASDYNYLSGTSMSSPHVAGAAALLRSVHPNWSVDNIRSALAMTADTTVKTQDATSDADFFDMGSGRIRVDLAAQAGLVLDETEADYLAAEPARGGDPRALNLPSITDNDCVGICRWSRTFTATQNGVWDVSAESFDNGLIINASPNSFSLNAGESQSVEFVIDTIDADKNAFVFGTVTLQAPNSPDLRIPVSVLPSIGNIPTDVQIEATRDNDSTLLADNEAVGVNSFVLTPYRLVKETIINSQVSQDSNRDDYLDDITDGVVISEIEVPNRARRLYVSLESSQAPDLDLFVARDLNNDGQISSFEELAQSTSSNSSEIIDINYPSGGRYFLVVQSFTGSGTQPDRFELSYAVVDSQRDASLGAQAPDTLEILTPFDMRIDYQLQDSELGDRFFGAIDMGSDAASLNNLGIITVDIERIEDDIQIDASPLRVDTGESFGFSINVAPNDTNEQRTYNIRLPLPIGTTVQSARGASVDNGALTYEITKAVNDTSSTSLPISLTVNSEAVPGPLLLQAQSELLNRSANTQQQTALIESVQIEGAPTIDLGDSPSSIFNVFETQTLTIPLRLNDPNNDALSLTFTQSQGVETEVTEADGVYSLIAPSVEADTLLVYEVVADDGNGNTAATEFSINVINNNAPTIDSISAPSSAAGGQRVTITVSASDPESDTLTVNIAGIAGSSATLTTPRTGNSVNYEISVFDGVNTVSDTVTISLTQPAQTTTDSGGGGGSFTWYGVGLLSILVWFRRRGKS